VGHGDEQMTKKHYVHVVKTTFPVAMGQGLGLMPGESGPTGPN
jgi:hypothetical protein